MTQIVVNVSDSSIVPGLRKVLSRIGGVEKVQVVREKPRKPSARQRFLGELRHAVGQAKDFKEGKVEFSTWEEMMTEI